jgi:hypothetical protein
MAYDLDELAGQLPPEPETSPRPPAATSGRKAFLPCFDRVMNEGVPAGSRNKVLFRVAVMLIREGYSSQSWPLLKEANKKCSPPLPEAELRSILTSAGKDNNGQQRYKSFGCEDVMAPFCSDDCPLKQKQARQIPPPAETRPKTEQTKAPDPGPVKAWELNQFLANDFMESAPYCQALIYPKGITVLGGEPKSGKTLFLLNLALALANGQHFLTFEISEPCRVLIIQAELSEGRLQERMASLSKNWATQANQLYLATLRGAFLNEKEGFEAVRKIVDEVGPDIIGIDPMTEFFSGDENKGQDMRLFLDRLSQLATGNRSIIISHHLRKSAEGGSPDFNSLRGSSVLFGKVDTAIIIAPELNGQITVDFKTRNCARPPKVIASFEDDLTLKFIKEAGARKITDQNILDAFKETPETSIKDLAEQLAEKYDCKPTTVKAHIRELIAAGAIKKQGKTKNATIQLF